MAAKRAAPPRLVAYELVCTIAKGVCECDNPQCPARLLTKYWAAQFAVGDELRLTALMSRS